jgi:hypothetical protein
MGVEPMNTGFADQRVSHFATGARSRLATKPCDGSIFSKNSTYFGCATVRRYGFTVL